jgi:hypothetical protein
LKSKKTNSSEKSIANGRFNNGLYHHHCHHHHHLAVKELVHLLNTFGLSHPQVSLQVILSSLIYVVFYFLKVLEVFLFAFHQHVESNCFIFKHFVQYKFCFLGILHALTWANNTIWACPYVCLIFPITWPGVTVETMGTKVITGTYFSNGNWDHCWNTLL